MAAERHRSTIGRRLLAERQRRELSAVELSQRAGLAPAEVSDIETGRAQPSVGTLYALAHALGFPVDVLLSGEPKDAAERGAGFGQLAQLVVGPADRRTVEARERRDVGAGAPARGSRPGQRRDPRGGVRARLGVGPGADVARGDEEYGLVLDGLLQVQVEDERVSLGPGDSLAFYLHVPTESSTTPTPARCSWMIVQTPRAEVARSSLVLLMSGWRVAAAQSGRS